MSNPEQPSKPNWKGTILETIFGEALHVEDLPATETTPETAALRHKGLLTGELVTQMVHTLRSDKTLGERINGLGSILWDLIGHRVTPVALTQIPTISFLADGSPYNVASGTILIPDNWIEMVRKEPYMQIGGLVNIGSQARDYYNDRIFVEVEGGKKIVEQHFGKNAVKMRAFAYEAEFLLVIKKNDSEYKLNDYQKLVLKDFPEGIDSLPPECWYETKPFVAPEE